MKTVKFHLTVISFAGITTPFNSCSRSALNSSSEAFGAVTLAADSNMDVSFAVIREEEAPRSFYQTNVDADSLSVTDLL